MSWITAPFAWLLKALYELTGSYGWAVILFGVVVNLILLPFMAKSKKSMMRTSRLQPGSQSFSAGTRETSKSSMKRWPSSIGKRRSTRCPAASGA